MTAEEKKTLFALDRKIDVDPTRLTTAELRVYRELALKYMSETIPKQVLQAEPFTEPLSVSFSVT